MKNNPVRWFEIYVQDMERAKEFYESVLDSKLEKLGNPNDPTIDMWKFRMMTDQIGSLNVKYGLSPK